MSRLWRRARGLMPLLKGCHPCLCKTKAATGLPSPNPDAASTQHFIRTSLLDCLQKGKRETAVLERDKKLSKKKDFYGKELNWPQAKLHNIFPSACTCSQAPTGWGGLSLTRVAQGMKVSGKKLLHQKPRVLPLPFVYFWDNTLRKLCGKLRGSKD